MRRDARLLGTFAVLTFAIAGDVVGALSERTYRAPSAALGSSGSDMGLRLNLEAGSNSVVFRVAVGPLSPDRPVHALVDSSFPLLDTDLGAAKGLGDHLSLVLPRGGWRSPVDTVTADQAAHIVSTKSAGVLVVAGGALPVTLAGPRRDFAPVRDWVRAGGELIFAGGGLFYWAARRGGTVFSTADLVGWKGEFDVLGDHLVDDEVRGNPAQPVFGPFLSTTGEALGTGYRDLQFGARMDQLETLNGWDAGWDSSPGSPGPRTSLAIVPLGLGRLVLFGSSLYAAETVVADDIARLLLSGVDIGPPLYTAIATVGAQRKASVTLTLPPPPPAGVRVLVFDSSGFAVYHATFTVTR